MLVALVTGLLFVLLAIGTPVGIAMAFTGALGLALTGGTSLLLGFLQTVPLSAVNDYELITVPMFILMAEFVVLSGVAQGIFSAAAAWVGHLRGGLGMATALAGAGFGAICGSSTASAATLSATSIPVMLERRYEPRLACGVVAISGTLAMLIPPSVALILYGLVADVSIGRLLIAGVVPGLLVTLTIIATVYVLVLRKPDRAPRGPRHSRAERMASLRAIWPTVLLFAAVTGTIYTGIATPTEASAIGAGCAFLIAALSKRMTFALLVKALQRTAYTTCMIMLIILGAKLFGYYVTMTQVAQDLVAWVDAADLPAYAVIALTILLYLILGCFMDQIAIIFLTVPILLPIVVALGYDPVWFGVIVVLAAEVGLVTPPVGLNVFVVARYASRPLSDVFGGVTPHVIAHILLIAVLAAFPQIILWLPNTMR